MAKIKQSVCWWCFVPAKIEPEKLVKAAADIGYEALELVDQEYWPLVKDHGLAMSSTRAHDSIPNGLNRRENIAQIEKEVTASVRLAEQWKIPNVICFSGNRAGLSDNVGA